jgi:hypothetical protein
MRHVTPSLVMEDGPEGVPLSVRVQRMTSGCSLTGLLEESPHEDGCGKVVMQVKKLFKPTAITTTTTTTTTTLARITNSPSTRLRARDWLLSPCAVRGKGRKEQAM